MPDAPAPGSWLEAPADPAELVDGALAGLDGLAEQPVGEHVAVFDGVHRALQDALATLDQA